MSMDYIYLDYNATTPLDDAVYEKICSSLKEDWGNPSSKSILGQNAKKRIQASRIEIASMTGACPDNVIITSGGTEANNMVIYSCVKFQKQQGSTKIHVITSTIEHDATLKAVEYLEDEGDIELTKIAYLTTDKVVKAIQNNTSLVTLMMANNETGVIFPIQEIGRYLESVNEQRKRQKLPRILFHIDAAQTIGKIPVNLKELHVDYITIVGHKFYGPRIGAISRNESAPLLPLFYGGGQEFGLRPGTENTAMIVGLGFACELVSKNLEEYNKHMLRIRNHLEKTLMECFGSKVIINFQKIQDRLPNTVSARFIGASGTELLSACPTVIASTGAACHSSSVSRILCEEIGEEAARSSIRLSVGRETTEGDIDTAVSLLMKAYEKLYGMKQ